MAKKQPIEQVEGETNEEIISADGEVTVGDVAAEVGVVEATVVTPIPRGPKQGVGAFAKEQLLAGNTTKETLALVLAKFPSAMTTLGCISYYRTKLVKEGKLVSSRTVVGAEAEAAASNEAVDAAVEAAVDTAIDEAAGIDADAPAEEAINVA